MFEARWQNKEGYACYSNTLSGAIELLLAFVPEEEAGCIYVYDNGTLVKKKLKGVQLAPQFQ